MSPPTETPTDGLHPALKRRVDTCQPKTPESAKIGHRTAGTGKFIDPENKKMRIEIHRCWMAGLTAGNGLRAASYNVYVPLEDCLAANGSDVTVTGHTNSRKYRRFEDATWNTRLAPGYERYNQWLKHEAAAGRQMLEMLHRHCPETRAATKYPLLWLYVDPKSSMDTVKFNAEIPIEDRSPKNRTQRRTSNPAKT